MIIPNLEENVITFPNFNDSGQVPVLSIFLKESLAN